MLTPPRLLSKARYYFVHTPSVATAQVKCEPSSPLDEQAVKALRVFGSDLPDEAFDAVIERISWNAVRSRAPTDA